MTNNTFQSHPFREVFFFKPLDAGKGEWTITEIEPDTRIKYFEAHSISECISIATIVEILIKIAEISGHKNGSIYVTGRGKYQTVRGSLNRIVKSCSKGKDPRTLKQKYHISNDHANADGYHYDDDEDEDEEEGPYRSTDDEEYESDFVVEDSDDNHSGSDFEPVSDSDSDTDSESDTYVSSKKRARDQQSSSDERHVSNKWCKTDDKHRYSIGQPITSTTVTTVTTTTSSSYPKVDRCILS